MTAGRTGRRGCQAAAILAGALLVGLADPHSGALPAKAKDQMVSVVLKHHQFVPQVVRASPGQMIRFENADDTLHSLTLLGREDVIGEVFVDPRTSYMAHIPSDMPAGIYELACTIHVEMRGQLSVAAP
jgi:plastocyanin